MIEVVFYNNAPIPVSQKAIKSIVFLVAKHEKKLQGVIEITSLNKQAIRKINKEYRNIDKPTDVLSFSAAEEQKEVGESFILPRGEKEVSYLYLCPPYIKEQAKRFKVSFREEFIRMLVHGLLHLAGHDHTEDTAAKRMFKLQERTVEQSASLT